MKKVALLMIISLISALLIVSGCGSQQKYMLSKEEAKQQRVIDKSGVANPATLHCMNTTGATWQAREGDGGEYGACTFSDGSWCEEWAYYRGECLPGMNMTSCTGQFWGKSTCPPDYEPVCGYINSTDSWENFNNACKACLKSEGGAEGYVLGACQ